MKIASALNVRAITHGIAISTHTTETKLIRNIQLKEGNSSCFRTDEREYCPGSCEWENDCKDFLIAAWKR